MRYVWLGPAVYVAAVLETACGPEIVAGVACPDFLGLTLVAAALLLNERGAVVVAVLIGLVADCLTPDRLGIDVVCSSVVAYGVLRVRGDRKSHHALEILSIMLAAISCLNVLSGGLRMIVNHRPVSFPELVLGSASAAVSTAVLALAMLVGCFLARRLGPQRGTKPLKPGYRPKPIG